MEDYRSKRTGDQIEALLDIVSQGGGGGGEGGGTITEAEITAMGFTKNLGTITEVKMNGITKGTSGVVDLGTVITSHQDISGKQDKITDLATIRTGAALGATALQSVPSEYVTETELTNKGYATTSALNDKVDKVSGKQLSTEDFTSALKAKLEGLSNYNDTEISNAVSSLQAQLNTLVSGNANDAINSFNEIIAFLDGVKDTQDLSSIIASIEQQIAGKMDKVTLATVATSGSYNDLSNKPTIPSAVTESTVSGWGFTKNTGTYSKPSGGIPKTDLASAVQTSLGKADTAVQPDAISEFVTMEDLASVATSGSYNDLTDQPDFIKGVAINGTTIADTSGTVYIPNASTAAYGVTKLNTSTSSTSTTESATPSAVKAAYDLANDKQDKLVSGSNIKTINGQSIVGSGNITIEGGSTDGFVTKETMGELVAAHAQALYDGNDVYALPSSASGDEDDVLVSKGTLKTINGQSLVGSGNIEISGGGGSSSGKEYVEAPLMIEPMGTTINFTSSVPLEPNKVYVAKKKVSAINMIFISTPSDSIGAEYTIMFQASTSELSIVLDTSYSWLWANGAIPTIEADTYYELSLVLNNINNTYIFKVVLTPFKPV